MRLPITSLRYTIAALAGMLIAGPRLNTITRSVQAGKTVYIKRRRWYAATLIAAATHSRARFRTLPVHEWHVWEPGVYRQYYGEAVAIIADGALVVPARPGRTLAEIIAGGSGTPLALAGVAAALHALAALHHQTITLPDGQARPFSHGDATVNNVTYEPASNAAFWFDFETAHDQHCPHAWRCADDLRAALFSATAVLGSSQIDALASIVQIAYPEPCVLAQLRTIISQLIAHPDPWHLAQAPLSYEHHQALSNALLRVLA